MDKNKRKICYVVQRYGMEVNGGAELLCRQMAELMVPMYDVEVLTSKAIDYMSWKDEYDQDIEDINGVTVRRFSVEKERVRSEFDEINGRFLNGSMKRSEEQDWINKQGPYVPALINYIKAHKNDYDVFVFFTYLYYTTVMGVSAVSDKAIVIPFAHNEPYIRMKIFDQVFLKPKAFFFQTDEERQLIRERYNNYHIPFRFGGAGVTLPDNISGEDFKKKYHLNSYIIYVGRIDAGKNCKELFDFFIRYKESHPSDLKLVLLGKTVIDIPDREDIVKLGFVSEEDKFNGIAGAEFLVLPYKFESLSIVVLEAFSLQVPVLVNGNCEVLKGHCTRSEAGFYYKGYTGFEMQTTRLLNNKELNKKMGEKGKKYVHENFQWDIIRKKFSALIEDVCDEES